MQRPRLALAKGTESLIIPFAVAAFNSRVSLDPKMAHYAMLCNLAGGPANDYRLGRLSVIHA